MENQNNTTIKVDAMELARIFKTLGDETRICILWELYENGESCVRDLGKNLQIDITSSGLSHQLRILRQEKLIKKRREGKNIYYSLDDENSISIIHSTIIYTNH